MKHTFAFFLLLVSTLTAQAQWMSANFPSDDPILAFGVHDTTLFWSYPAASGDSLIFRYFPPDQWARYGKGLDRTQGNITSFASLGNYFFAGSGPSSTGNGYLTTNNGLSWTDPIGGPVGTNGTYVFAQYATRIARSVDSGAHWEHLSTPAGNIYAAISGKYVFSVTSNGVYRSTDSGGTWNPVTTPISNITCFAVLETIIYAANGNQIIVSTDSGAMWDTMSTNFTVSSLATDGKRLFAGGDSGVCMLGTDGVTWTNESDTGTLKGHGVVALGVFDTLLFADFVNVNYPYDLYDRSIPQLVDTTPSLVVQTQPGDTLSIYPNPASSMVTIVSGSTSIYGVSVLNVLGENVLDEPNLRESNITLDLSKLPSGTYFLQIETANGSVLRKVVKEE